MYTIVTCDVWVHTVSLVYMCMMLFQDTVVIMYCKFFIIKLIDGKLMCLCMSIFLQAIHSTPESPLQDLRGDKKKRVSDTSQSMLLMSQQYRTLNKCVYWFSLTIKWYCKLER